MSHFRRAVLAFALVGSGLAATTGAAFANEDHHDEDTQSSGIANVDDTQTVVPTEACGNNVPVNVLGVQVPIEDVAGNVPAGSGSDDNGTNDAGVDKNCASGTDLDS